MIDVITGALALTGVHNQYPEHSKIKRNKENTKREGFSAEKYRHTHIYWVMR